MDLVRGQNSAQMPLLSHSGAAGEDVARWCNHDSWMSFLVCQCGDLDHQVIYVVVMAYGYFPFTR